MTFPALCATAQRSAAVARAHYPDARSCLYATYEAVAENIYQDFARAFACERGWRRGLRLAGRTLLARMAANPAEARLCFVEILGGDHELLRRREKSRRRLVALFVRELGRRREQPELFHTQLELLIGAGFQTISRAVASGSLEQLAALERELETRAFVFEPVTQRPRGGGPRSRGDGSRLSAGPRAGLVGS